MNAWLLAGYVMLHFLWVGTLVAAVGAALRLACRRGSANVRYAASLAMLAAVACTPVAIAVVLASDEAFFAGAWKPPAPPVDVARTGLPIEGVHRQSRGLSGDVNASSNGLPPRPAEDLGRATPDAAPSLRGEFGAEVMQRAVEVLPYVWLAGAPVTFLLLAAGLVGSRRLTHGGTPLVDGPIAEACVRLRAALGVSRRVTLAAVERLAQPVLVGILRPTILLPAAALNGWTIEELEMVLLHELAHVRRWDNAVNLVQRLVESALFFHPCIWLASRQVRRDREDCCDAIVVQHTQRPEAYAELLVSVASNLPSEPGRPRPRLFGAAMADHPLASRVRRILKLEDEPMWVSRRTVGMLVVLAVGLSAAVYRAALAAPPVVETEEKAEAADDVNAQVAADDDVLVTMVYPIGDVRAIDPVAWLRLTGVGEIEVRWFEKNQSVVLSAPKSVHREFAELLEKTRKATQRETTEQEASRKQMELCQSQLNQLDREIADLEVMKQVALTQSQSPSALELAVASEMDKDPTMSMYKNQLFAFNQQIQSLGASMKNPRNAQLRRLQSQAAEIEQAMTDYRTKAEADARDRLAKIPNEALRAVMIEHDVRAKFLSAKKVELEKTIAELEAQIDALKAKEPPVRAGADEDTAANAEPAAERTPEPVVKIIQNAMASGRRVTAYLEVKAGGPDADRKYAEVVARFKSLEVLKRAAAILAETYPELIRREDAAGWIGDRLRVSFAADSPILELRLMCAREATYEDEAVVRAVIGAYREVFDGSAKGAASEGGADSTAGRAVDAGAEGRVPLYDGKTFAQWRDLWRTELKVAKRTEAIDALAAFARAGYGREAAEALLDVAGEYDFSVFDDTAEGQLKQRVIELLTQYPNAIAASIWLPTLVERFKADPAKWRSLVRAVLGSVADADEAMRTTIRELLGDPKYDVALAAWQALVRSAENLGHEEEHARLLREGLNSDSAEIRKIALSWTGFDNLEKFPQLFDLLFVDRADVALEARKQLGMTSEKFRGALAERLWEVFHDPDRAASHVAALRAIGVLYRTSGGTDVESGRAGSWRSATAEQLMAFLQTGPRDQLAAAAWSLADDWSDADWVRGLVERGEISQERLEELQSLAPDIAAEREAAMGPMPPSNGGGFF